MPYESRLSSVRDSLASVFLAFSPKLLWNLPVPCSLGTCFSCLWRWASPPATLIRKILSWGHAFPEQPSPIFCKSPQQTVARSWVPLAQAVWLAAAHSRCPSQAGRALSNPLSHFASQGAALRRGRDESSRSGSPYSVPALCPHGQSRPNQRLTSGLPSCPIHSLPLPLLFLCSHA